MFCQNCGAQLPDNAAFCNYCGNPMQQPQQYQQPEQYQQYQQPEQYQQPQQYPQYQQYQQYQQPQQPQQKKSKLPIIIGAAAAVLALVIILLVAGGKNKDNNGGGENFNVTTQAAEETKDTAGHEHTEPVETTAAAEEKVENNLADITADEFDFSAYKVGLKQVATFTEPQDVSFSSSLPVMRENVDGKAVDTLLSFDGKNNLNKGYHNYTYFGQGVTAAYRYDGEVPKCELVNVNTGDVYLSDAAVKIDAINDRYYYVIYVTEKTTNKEECFIYFTDSIFSMSPDEDDVLYKGYGKIFDLEKKQFVEGIQIDKPGTDILVCEDTLCLEVDWNTYDFYGADGKKISETMADVYLGSKYILREADKGCAVYDSKLNEVGFVTEGRPIDNENYQSDLASDRYLEYKDNDYNSGIMTITGEKILDAKYDFCSGTWNDYLIMSNEDGSDSLYLGDGTEILPSGTYQSIYKDDEYPFFRLQDLNDKKFLYLPGGQTIDITDAREVEGVFYRTNETYGTEEYLIYKTGEWKTIVNADILEQGLLKTDEGIMDMFSGELLISGSFKWVYSTEEYVYIFTDGSWMVYQIEA